MAPRISTAAISGNNIFINPPFSYHHDYLRDDVDDVVHLYVGFYHRVVYDHHVCHHFVFIMFMLR